MDEYVVQLPLFQDQTTTKPTLLTAAQSELLALNDHQFLVLARDSSGGFTFPSPGLRLPQRRSDRYFRRDQHRRHRL